MDIMHNSNIMLTGITVIITNTRFVKKMRITGIFYSVKNVIICYIGKELFVIFNNKY